MKTFTVSQVTAAVRRQVDAAQAKVGGRFWMEGEISEWKQYHSATYFTVKDDSSVMGCVAWAGVVNKLPPAWRAKAADRNAFVGQKIQLYGSVKIVADRGAYRFQADELKIQDARGELMLRFEEMKERLAKEGLFAHSAQPRKRPLLVHRIGVVTSAAGAVVHDICHNAILRFPDIQIRLFPVKVQGAGAAEDVAKGIRYFNALTRWVPDVLIVGRGGGSMEDLWAFNEEPVVRAVYESRIPVVSAVGHQTDFTLCDFAADHRSGTPSIAAQDVVPQKIDLYERVRKCEAIVNQAFKSAYNDRRWRLKALRQRLGAAPGGRLADYANRLESAKAKLPHAPAEYLSRLAQRLEAAKLRLAHAAQSCVAREAARLSAAAGRLAPAAQNCVSRESTRLALLAGRLAPAMDRGQTNAAHRLAAATQKLELLNPKATLKRGYSITFGPDGTVLQSAAAATPGATIRTLLADGEISATVRQCDSATVR